MGSVVIDEPAMNTLLHSRHGGVGLFLLKLGIMVKRAAKRMAPDGETGHLGASIDYTIEEDADGIYVRIGSDLLYAIFVEYGTGIYGTGPEASHQRITAKDGGVLHFVIDGQDIFVKSVAGQQDQPYLRPALREVMARI